MNTQQDQPQAGHQQNSPANDSQPALSSPATSNPKTNSPATSNPKTSNPPAAAPNPTRSDTVTANPAADNTGNAIKDPKDWITGDEPMTEAQRSYLRTLAGEAHELPPDNMTKAEASEKIEELQHKTGRGEKQ